MFSLLELILRLTLIIHLVRCSLIKSDGQYFSVDKQLNVEQSVDNFGINNTDSKEMQLNDTTNRVITDSNLMTISDIGDKTTESKPLTETDNNTFNWLIIAVIVIVLIVVFVIIYRIINICRQKKKIDEMSPKVQQKRYSVGSQRKPREKGSITENLDHFHNRFVNTDSDSTETTFEETDNKESDKELTQRSDN